MSLSPSSLKSACRQNILARRDALSETQKEELSLAITGKLLELYAYRNAVVVMAYMSFGGELYTEHLINDVMTSGKTLVLPRIDKIKRELVIYKVENLERDLEPGMWGIREPRTSCERVTLKDIDLLVIPGVAFDAHGGRLGYGAGFYDKLLYDNKLPLLVALAFDVQMVDGVPMESHDCFIDGVVTESATYWRKNT